MNKIVLAAACLSLVLIVASGCNKNKPAENKTLAKADLKLPGGFSATIIADSLGPVRHLAVNSQGNIYIKLNALKDGKGIIFLADTNHDGIMEQKSSFAGYPGTGIRIKNGYLYSSSNSAVYRYKLNDKEEVTDTSKTELIVKGLVDKKRDNSKSIALDDEGNLYVTVG